MKDIKQFMSESFSEETLNEGNRSIQFNKTFKTRDGVRFTLLDKDKADDYDGYDREMAMMHIMNADCIIVYDGTLEPIDDEYILDDIYTMIEKNKYK